MRRISKIIIIEVIALFFIFAYGAVYLTNSTPSNTTEQPVQTNSSFPTKNDLQWMQSTYDNSDMFILFSNKIINMMNGNEEMNPTALLSYCKEVTSWARAAQKQGNGIEVSPKLDYAKTEYSKATGEYATMGDYINDGVLAVQRGDVEDGTEFFETGIEHYNKAVLHYNNYFNVVQNYIVITNNTNQS